MGAIIQYANDKTGLSPVFLIWDFAGDVWNVVGATFQNYLTANRAQYEIAMTEEGTASRHYNGTFDGAISDGSYSIEIREAAGETAKLGGIGEIGWDGTDIIEEVAVCSAASIADAVWDELRSGHTVVGSFGEGVILASAGLNNIDTTDPAGVPGNFRERLNWLYARFAFRAAMSLADLTVYKDDGATPMTTQLLVDTGSVQEVSEVT